MLPFRHICFGMAMVFEPEFVSYYLIQLLIVIFFQSINIYAAAVGSDNIETSLEGLIPMPVCKIGSIFF
jgi:hypothetical protein